jgi:hypothetical protein
VHSGEGIRVVSCVLPWSAGKWVKFFELIDVSLIEHRQERQQELAIMMKCLGSQVWSKVFCPCN